MPDENKWIEPDLGSLDDIIFKRRMKRNEYSDIEGYLDSVSAKNAEDVCFSLKERQLRIATALKQFVIGFQKELRMLEGESYGTLEKNQEVAKLIQATADRLGLLFACPNPECKGAPSRFRCSKGTNAPNGMFTFSHGRHTHGGRTKIPKLTLVKEVEEKPEDPA